MRLRRKPYVRVYMDGAGEWRWTRKAGNNKTVADSAEGYESLDGVMKAAARENPGLKIRVKK